MAELAAMLFDMDGTLVDTADANFAAYATALEEAGVRVERDIFDRVSQGRQWRQFLPQLLAGRQADVASVAARKQALYPAMMAYTRLNDPVLSMALALRQSLKIGLVTTASGHSVSAVLGAHGLTHLFDVVVTGDDVVEPKPDPAAYLLAAARLEVLPAQCIVIEDSDIGVESARLAGMAVLRVEAFPSTG